jgi:hypothetical protein
MGAPARADVGGEVPAPGLCDYPFIGHSEMAGGGPFANVFVYVCDGPTEINGSHWHAELNGEAVQAAASAGISMAFFNAGGSMTGNLGGIGGSTSWRCPDMTLAAPPNPPGAWKNEMTPAKCKTVAPNPDLPPPADQEPPAAEGPPAPPAPPAPAPAPGWEPGLSPAITNPDKPNPEALPGGHKR